MSMVGFPLLLIPLAIYNIIVLLMPGVDLAEPIVKLTLISGAQWPLTLGDMLLALAILLLLFEIIKAARPGAKYLTDHLLSLVVFGGAVAEFLMWPRFATSTYSLLALLALVDFLSGIALRTRRGMQTASGELITRDRVKQPDSLAEPQFDPAPMPAAVSAVAPAMPPAAAVAESVLLEHPEPRVLQPSSPEIPSPGLQPGNGAPPAAV